ncbi:MAG: MCE family protein [Bdellovibrionales bacterium]|nr:MCE family protein [Bdellovibrionales bacterium]
MIPKKTIFIFVAGALGLFGLLVIGSSLRQGWFAPHDTFSIEFPSGDGLTDGTPVSIAGLKAGRVTSVELGESNKVIVKISIQSKFADRIREDSKALVGRPFIIGEKAISITPGSPLKPRLKEGSRLPGEESMEITDMLSGGRMSPYFQTFTKLLDQLRLVIEGDGGENNANLVQVYQQAYRSLKAVERMSKEVEIMRKDFATTPEMKKLVREAAQSAGDAHDLINQMNEAMPALTKLSGDVGTMLPALSKTLGETVFTLQAMQRSFILRGAVADLKKEQAEEEKRRPASVPETSVEDVMKSQHH